MESGYSGKPLREKLGVKPEHRAAFVNAPEGYVERLGISQAPFAPEEGSIDMLQAFVTSAAELKEAFPRLKEALVRNGALWVSWPKKSSGIPTDLRESTVQEIGLDGGLVDVKVIAVDDVWSGLKFVYRLKDREG